MKASELRIGNYIMHYDSIGTVIEIGNETIRIDEGDNITSDNSFSDAWSGIELTDEWLTRLGWQYYNGKTSGTLTFDFPCKLDVDFVDGEIKIKSHYQGADMYFKTNIQYVHQLQNLYHALTQHA